MLRDNPMLGPSLTDALSYVHQHSVPGSEEAMPLVMEATIEQLWGYFLVATQYGFEEKESALDIIWESFCKFSDMLRPLAETPSPNQRAAKRIIKAMLESDLIDLIGGAFLALNPTLDESSPRDG
ncbi:hypothetical protein FRC11_013819, partial [Ceratobasidium sp. 423]